MSDKIHKTQLFDPLRPHAHQTPCEKWSKFGCKNPIVATWLLALQATSNAPSNKRQNGTWLHLFESRRALLPTVDEAWDFTLFKGCTIFQGLHRFKSHVWESYMYAQSIGAVAPKVHSEGSCWREQGAKRLKPWPHQARITVQFAAILSF